MRSTLLVVGMLCLSMFVTYGLWFTRSRGWAEGQTSHLGLVPADHPVAVDVWESRGWLGYTVWQGTSEPPEHPGSEPTLYARRMTGRVVGSDAPLVISCCLTALAWIASGWQLRRWIVETPFVTRALRTWRIRLALLGTALLPGIVGILMILSPPGGGPGLGGAYAAGPAGMVLVMSCYAAPVSGALGYVIGWWCDHRAASMGSHRPIP